MFDLWYALNKTNQPPDTKLIIDSFLKYMDYADHQITRAIFEQNLLEKKEDLQFSGDITPLLTAEISWDFSIAFDDVMNRLISTLPGSPWQGYSNH